MKTILFHKNHVGPIERGDKTMTARCWKRKPFHVGELVRAQTGYSLQSAFARLRIVAVVGWDGDAAGSDLITPELVRKEGFSRREGFEQAWYSTNADRLGDAAYRSWFFEFEVVELLGGEQLRLF